jgi:hypothetical protein
MTPKEKAIQLVESMAFSCRECDYEAKAKQCALIAVDLLLYYSESPEAFIEFEEIKQEIENL